MDVWADSWLWLVLGLGSLFGDSLHTAWDASPLSVLSLPLNSLEQRNAYFLEELAGHRWNPYSALGLQRWWVLGISSWNSGYLVWRTWHTVGRLEGVVKMMGLCNQKTCLDTLHQQLLTRTSLFPSIRAAAAIKKLILTWSSHCGSVETNLTSIHEDTGSIPDLILWVKDPALPSVVV